MKCPICDKELESTTDSINNIISEEHTGCRDEHHYYTYQYAYGATEEVIGNVTIHSHYADSAALRKLQSKQYKAVVELEREYYQQQTREG